VPPSVAPMVLGPLLVKTASPRISWKKAGTCTWWTIRGQRVRLSRAPWRGRNRSGVPEHFCLIRYEPQTARKFLTLGVLRWLGVVTPDAPNPIVGVVIKIPKTPADLEIFSRCNVAIGTADSLANVAVEPLWHARKAFSLLMRRIISVRRTKYGRPHEGFEHRYPTRATHARAPSPVRPRLPPVDPVRRVHRVFPDTRPSPATACAVDRNHILASYTGMTRS